MDVDVDEKPFHVARLIKAADSEVGIIKDEMDRLRKLKSIAETNVQQLRQYLIMLMMTLDKKALDDGIHKIRLRKTNPRLIIEDDDFIPDEFIKYETVVEKQIDKDAIKTALKDGREITGLYFLQDETVVVKWV